MATRILTSADVEILLHLPEAAEQLHTALVDAHRKMSRGTVIQPVPHALADPTGQPKTRSAVVPMLAQDLSSGIFVSKILADAPANREIGLPAQRSTLAVYDAATGECTGLIDGRALTRIRTAAVTAMATKLLARPESKVLCLIGAGPLAVEHGVSISRAWSEVSSSSGFDWVIVWSRSQQKSDEAAATIDAKLRQAWGEGAASHHFPQVSSVSSREEAIRAADVLCTLTPSEEAYVHADWLKAGSLVNAVGSPPRPHFAEILPNVFERSALTVVDSIEIATAESGNIGQALEVGSLNMNELVELGDCLQGPVECDDRDIRVFNSIGIGAQDLAAAVVIMSLAEHHDSGTAIALRP